MTIQKTKKVFLSVAILSLGIFLGLCAVCSSALLWTVFGPSPTP